MNPTVVNKIDYNRILSRRIYKVFKKEIFNSSVYYVWLMSDLKRIHYRNPLWILFVLQTKVI